jgi:excisionase family DNA binding protein
MEYLTVEQVAERLQVSAWTVRRWLREGELEGSHLSDRAGWRVPEGAIERFLQARSNQADNGAAANGSRETGKAAA